MSKHTVRPDRVESLLANMANEVTLARDEGLTELEIAAALGLLVARLAPTELDRLGLFEFAARNAAARKR